MKKQFGSGWNLEKWATACVDRSSWWWKNCVRQRRRGSKICLECPLREALDTLPGSPPPPKTEARYDEEGWSNEESSVPHPKPSAPGPKGKG